MFDIKKWKSLNQLEGHVKNNFEPFWEHLREKSVSAPGFLICMAKIEAMSINLQGFPIPPPPHKISEIDGLEIYIYFPYLQYLLHWSVVV